MNTKSLKLLLILLIVSVNSIAQWGPLIKNKDSVFFNPQFVSYINALEAYAINSGGKLYYTSNNWEQTTPIPNNLFANESVMYFEMTSKTKGILVTRSFATSPQKDDSCFVYTTQNGGYQWEKVYTLPVIFPSFSETVSQEKVQVKSFGTKLYVLFGDVIAHGKIDGKNWKHVRYPVLRYKTSSDFEVLNDTIWSFRGAYEFNYKCFTGDQGDTWHEEFLPSLGLQQNYSGLDGKIQKFTGDHKLIEFNPQTQTWEELNKPYGYKVEHVIQISPTQALVSCWHWPSSLKKHVIYNRKTEEWNVLDSMSSFINMMGHPNFEYLFARPTGFITLSPQYELQETKDYGQTWNPMVSVEKRQHLSPKYFAFSNRLIVVLGNTLTFSIDSGKTWKNVSQEALSRALLWKPLWEFKLNNQNQPNTLFLLGPSTYEIIVEGDSILLKYANFRYSDQNVQVKSITSNIHDFTFTTFIHNDSLKFAGASGKTFFNQKSAFPLTHPFENIQSQIAMNSYWIVFSVRNKVYVYDRNSPSNSVIELPDTFTTDVNTLELLQKNTLFAASQNSVIVYDLNTFTGTLSYVPLPLIKDAMVNDSGIIYYLTQLPLGVFTATIEAPESIVADSTFNYSSVTGLIRFWNDAFWIATDNNIYKQLPKSTSNSAICYEVESIWPNPILTEVNFLVRNIEPQPLNVRIHDMNGKQVFELNKQLPIGLYDNKINTSTWQSGLYVLTFSYKNCPPKRLKLIKN